MASGLFKVAAIRKPSLSQLAEIADKIGFDIPEEELKEYSVIINKNLESLGHLDDLDEPTQHVKYPRTGGYKPKKDDNIYNGWSHKTDIRGANKGVLAGRTVAVKDSIAVAGVPMINGSKQLEGFIPDYDATIVTRVLDAGARVTGKATCEDLCISGNSFTSCTGPVLNPLKAGYSAGGSSNGNAVLLASGEVDMGLAADQGGSIRIPASFCGIIGMKPTFGLVPYTGALSMDASLDCIGPMTRTVRDCALLMEVISGYDEGLDPRQPIKLTVPRYTELLSEDLTGLKVGVLREGFLNCEPDVEKVVREAARNLSKAGALVDEVSVPMHLEGAALWKTIFVEGVCRLNATSGCNIGLAGFHTTNTYDALAKAWRSPKRQFVSPTVKMIYLYHQYVADTCGPRYYAKAQNMTRALRSAYDVAFRTYDVIIMPTILFKVPRIPAANASITEYISKALSTVGNTASFNLTDHPALTINAGFDGENGLPIGMMIVGRQFEDATVMKVAYAHEKLMGDS